MGDIADAMLSGVLCQICGEYLGGEGDGFPVTCGGCKDELEAMHDEEIRATAQEIMAAEDEEMHQEEAQEYEAELDARYHSLRAEEERGEDGSPEG